MKKIYEFCGYSGCGKTTICDLIIKKYGEDKIFCPDLQYKKITEKNSFNKILFIFKNLSVFNFVNFFFVLSCLRGTKLTFKNKMWFIKYFLLICCFYKQSYVSNKEIILISEGISSLNWPLNKNQEVYVNKIYSSKYFKKIYEIVRPILIKTNAPQNLEKLLSRDPTINVELFNEDFMRSLEFYKYDLNLNFFNKLTIVQNNYDYKIVENLSELLENDILL